MLHYVRVLTLCIVSVCFTCVGCTSQPAVSKSPVKPAKSSKPLPKKADFGDAPDPGFPSLDKSEGPKHWKVSEEWIGFSNASDTTVEVDSIQVDKDMEGTPPSVWVRIYAVSIPAPTVAAVVVSGKPPFDTPRYLNVLHDVDANGQWGGGVHNEWIARNISVDLRQGRQLANGNRRLWVQVPPFFYSDDRVLDPRYMRITLTREKIDASKPWTGKGPKAGFAYGETEDNLINLNGLGGGGGGGGKKTCTLRWTAMQNGIPVGVVKMNRKNGNYGFKVNRVAGKCEKDLPPPIGTLFSLGLKKCVELKGAPLKFDDGMAPNPWNAGLAPAPPNGPWLSPIYLAKWNCDEPKKKCVVRCDVDFAYDPEEEIVMEPGQVFFGFEGDEVPEKEDPWCDVEEYGDLCTPDGRVIICGDGKIDKYEKCDDGNRQDGDGCNSLCFPEEKGELKYPGGEKPEIEAREEEPEKPAKKENTPSEEASKK